ncbi:MAG: hypothetical protein HRU36_04740 [Rickettsiales bacterium]|nr:hypothetical protein [Rickettsiales bacterium]
MSSGHPCQASPVWQTTIYDWDGTHTLEICEQEFSQRDIVRCAGEGEHSEL